MGGEFKTSLQIAGPFSGDFNIVLEVRSLRWTRTKSLQHVKEKEKQLGGRCEEDIAFIAGTDPSHFIVNR